MVFAASPVTADPPVHARTLEMRACSSSVDAKGGHGSASMVIIRLAGRNLAGS